jgi:hypothetical protein
MSKPPISPLKLLPVRLGIAEYHGRQNIDGGYGYVLPSGKTIAGHSKTGRFTL